MMRINFSPKWWLICVLAVLFVWYVLFQSKALIMGPEVWIVHPRDGQVVSNTAITMSGGSRNIAWIELNGRQIFTDENGFWNEKLLVSDGPSIMTVKARDRFGRSTEESILIYKK